MSRRTRKFVFGLALLAVALLAVTSTLDLLPHRHARLDERVCPICHAPVFGLRATGLKLPSLNFHARVQFACDSLSASYPAIRHIPARGPPQLS